MSPNKNAAIEAAMRAMVPLLKATSRPRFRETTMAVGEHLGFRVGIQFDSTFLHALNSRSYWLRCELEGDNRYFTVIRYLADGRIIIIDGGGGTTSDYTDEFEFSTLAEMEHVLDQVCRVVVAWVPPEEEQDVTD